MVEIKSDVGLAAELLDEWKQTSSIYALTWTLERLSGGGCCVKLDCQWAIFTEIDPLCFTKAATLVLLKYHKQTNRKRTSRLIETCPQCNAKGLTIICDMTDCPMRDSALSLDCQ